ncbi:nucleotidyltransferase domain-containing protein [Enhygromyxa salina]|uniref:Putative nucleotidyltransferase n=1 Tax=Enhygromyxa salina TaxID=215803 RepID=A0A2S9YSI6_9BACT|nr:nucleotidyltransferase domain-containing protein [Enhygromyxa salina]PRQ08056.1 putative nucleotidyltransferase [Enhygromyxa salina]
MPDQNPPDLELCRRYLALRPPPGRLLLCGVTGSHHYGFSSADSDIDLKGIHQAPTEQILSLFPGRDNHDALEDFEGVECDLTTNELSQALRLLIKGNGNLHERLATPFQLVESQLVAELQDLGLRARSRASHGHYRGYLHGMRREHLKQDPPRAKSLLYTFRVALTGIHLLETGELVAHLPSLAPEYGFAEVLELAEVKIAGAEKEPAPEPLATELRARWPELEERLDAARDRSPLPEQATNVDEIEAWLVARRREGFGS